MIDKIKNLIEVHTTKLEELNKVFSQYAPGELSPSEEKAYAAAKVLHTAKIEAFSSTLKIIDEEYEYVDLKPYPKYVCEDGKMVECKGNFGFVKVSDVSHLLKTISHYSSKFYSMEATNAELEERLKIGHVCSTCEGAKYVSNVSPFRNMVPCPECNLEGLIDQLKCCSNCSKEYEGENILVNHCPHSQNCFYNETSVYEKGYWVQALNIR